MTPLKYTVFARCRRSGRESKIGTIERNGNDRFREQLELPKTLSLAAYILHLSHLKNIVL